MPYNYEYINKLEEHNTVKYTLIISDNDKIMPTNHIPILLNSSENTEEKLSDIAKDCINLCITEYNLSIPKTEIIVDEEVVVDEEVIVDEIENSLITSINDIVDINTTNN